MLSIATPSARPRPPARIRRSSSNLKTSSPPPAYASFTQSPPEEAPSNAVVSVHDHREDDWTNERSRDELAELLLKADDIIKEREHELGLSSAACKSLYENNLSLKAKHRELLARIPPPLSPFPSSSSLGLNFDHVNPESDDEMPAHRSVYGPRKISMTLNEVSLLAEQNAELLDKLEKLESESVSSDRASRRELRKLEKEIAGLKEAFALTQEKSEELEEKAKAGLGSAAEKVVEEAWRKKEKREARLKALRKLRREADDLFAEKKNFAPEGSSFGGPTAASPIFPNPNEQAPSDDAGTEYALISQLLSKVLELESANAKIIHQQIETANQLQAVQRETESITKVYECLANPNELLLELDTQDAQYSKAAASNTSVMRFRSLRQRLEDHASAEVYNDRQPRIRHSVVGIFEGSTPDKARQLMPTFEANDEPSSPTLSNLHIFSSPSHNVSPRDRPQLTLQSELGDELDNSWLAEAENSHLKPTGFRNISQRSLPGSFDADSVDDDPYMPTPKKNSHYYLSVGVHAAIPKSPRMQRMSNTLRSRKERWVDGRFKDSLTGNGDDSASIHSLLPRHMLSAVDTMVESLTGEPVCEELSQDSLGGPKDSDVLQRVESPSVDIDKQGRGFGAVLLELWLWLQFAIIIMFFLWSMARKGPKSVLIDAGSKQAMVRRT